MDTNSLKAWLVALKRKVEPPRSPLTDVLVTVVSGLSVVLIARYVFGI